MNELAVSETPASRSKSSIVAVSVLAAVLGLGLPQFVRQPLTNDPVYYDLQAANVRAGGVLYRDMAEPNLPGVVWLHLVVRASLGSSSEALRFVDFSIFCSSLLVLSFAMKRLGCQLKTCVWCAAGLFWFYFSLAEWSHCQRDTWQLLPAGLALWMRERQIVRARSAGDSASPTKSYNSVLFAIVEGGIWGVAVWIKPHIVIPAAMVWLASAWLARNWRRSLIDFLGLFLGGVIVGVAGSLWLVRHGAWPHFLETLLVMNPQYVAGVRSAWSSTFFLQMCGRLMPWILLHFVAIPATLCWIWQQWKLSRAVARDRSQSLTTNERLFLWGTLYLGWLFQASFLQILFDYVHVPYLVLAIVLFAVWCERQSTVIAKYSVSALTLAAIVLSPLVSAERLRSWPQCVSGPNDPALKNHLRRVHEPDWEGLEKVAQFLERQQLQHGDLICYNNHLIHLYPRLGIRPSIRFVYQQTFQTLLSSRREDLAKDLQQHPPRFIVSDLNGTGISQTAIDGAGLNTPPQLPAEFPEQSRGKYPWRYPIVFRSRGILVHEYRASPAK